MIYLLLVPLVARRQILSSGASDTNQRKKKGREAGARSWINGINYGAEQDSKAQFEYISYASALAASPLSAPKTPN
jgi:hypothetical protein